MLRLYQASQVALKIKNLPANVGDIRDMDSVPESGRFPGEEHGNPLQYFRLENPMGREAWGQEDYCPYGHRELDITEGTQQAHIHLQIIG